MSHDKEQERDKILHYVKLQRLKCKYKLHEHFKEIKDHIKQFNMDINGHIIMNIVALTETCLNSEVYNSELFSDKHIVFKKDRKQDFIG